MTAASNPMLSQNGIGLESSIDTSDTAYDSYSGTSMATPSAAGSSALLAQLHQREFSGQFMRASMLKGLLIHTADDLGRTGPDYMFGWGLINIKEAADVILAHKNSPGAPKMIEGTITSSARAFTNEFTWNGASPIRATLAWTDPAGTAQADNSRTPVLRNNLDLRIIAPDGSTVYKPYIMPFVGNWSDASMTNLATTGSNYVDNVERVDIASPAQAGQYKGHRFLRRNPRLRIASLLPCPYRRHRCRPGVIANAGLALVSDSCGVGNGVPDPGEVVGLTLALRNNGTIDTTNLVATLLNTNGVTAPSTAQNYGALVAGGATVTNTFSFIASGECGGTISVTFALTDGTNDYGTISQSYTLGEMTAVTVTNANPAAIAITDDSTANPYPSTIQVAGLVGTVTKVTVTLVGFSHTYPSDLDVVLASPDGRRVALMGAVGGDSSVSGLTMTFDDDAEGPLGTPMTSGTFLPSGSISAMPSPAPVAPYAGNLAEFSGANPNGTWSLYVFDAETGDSGNIASGWRMAITAGEPTCCASNQPPGIVPVGPKTVAVGENLTFPVIARDLTDGDAITLDAESLPSGATFPLTVGTGAVTNQFVWNNASPTGSYAATFRAIDKDGTNVMTVLIDVFLPPPNAPASIWAAATNGAGFTAAWSASPNATSYRLDVATNDVFANGGSGQETLVSEGFTGGATAPEGWTFTSIATYTTAGNYGNAPPSLKFDATGDRIVTPALQNPTNLSFWVKGQGVNTTSALLIEGASAGTWSTIANFDSLPNSATTLATPVDSTVTNIRFTYTKSVGNLALDDVLIVADAATPSYVPGYSNLTVAGTSQIVGGLDQGVTYHFRARAVNDGGTSANSPVASVTTTLDDTPPAFTSGTGPYAATTGIEVAFNVAASGYPVPTITLDSTTASGGYTFNAGTLSYIPPVPDTGAQTFTFVASNTEGAATQTVTVVVTEGPPPAPASVWAAITNTTDFTAAWNDVAGATSYRLDVSENELFSGSSSSGGGTEPFSGVGGGTVSSYLTRNWTNNGIVWTAYKARIDQPINDDALCLRDESGAYFISGTITGGVDTLSIISQQKFSGSGGTFDIFVNGIKVGNTLPITTTATIHSISNIAVVGNFTLMITNSGVARAAFDDLTWSGPASSSDAFLPGYSNLVVTGTNQLVSGLTPGATYYFRARSANAEGSGPNSPVASVTLEDPSGPPPAPSTIWASITNATGFTTAWSASANATSYRLDVSTNSLFASGGVSTQSTLAFNPAMPSTITNNGWSGTTLTGTVYTTLLANNSSVLSPAFSTEGFTNLTVDLQSRTFGGVNASANTITISLSTNNGAAWQVLGTVIPPGNSFTVMPRLTNTTLLGHPQTRVRWQTLGATGSVGAGLSNLTVRGWSSGSVPSFVPGYEDLTVATTSQTVTGLTEGVTYYFRARAANGEGTSPNSPTSSVVTAASSDPDSDSDGIPDQWEMDNFGSLTNVNDTSDWDVDGFIDLHEFLAGTQPTNKLSLLEVDDSAVSVGGGIVIQWPGITGKSYDLSRTTNLLAAIYQVIATNIPGVNPMNVYTDSTPTVGQSIYRIELSPAP
jgi:subtilisin-like proprotein convertase family protein